jgi:hypothetical protein
MRTITTPTERATRHPGADIIRRAAATMHDTEQWAVVLYVGGATVDEIAPALGISRDEVRHSILRAGLTWRRGARVIDPLAIMREVRCPGVVTLRDVGRRLGYSEETVRHTVAALGMTDIVRRLMRMRRRAARRAAVEGSTPALGDLVNRSPRVRGIVSRRPAAARVA